MGWKEEQTGPEVRPLFPVDPDRKDPALYAPNGSILLVKNLNAESVHPNPWRPPTFFEAHVPTFSNYHNLTTWLQPTLHKNELAFENDGLTERLQWYGVRSIAFGNVFAIWDLTMVKNSKALPPLGKVARWAYLVSPYLAMSTTFIGTHHLINKMVSKPNENKPWVYAASMFSPAAVWGTYKRSLGSFIRLWAVGGFFIWTFKAMNEVGLAPAWAGAWIRDGTNESPINNPLEGFAKQTSRWANRWMGGDNPSYPQRNFDESFHEKTWQIEPSWKKHIPEEDKNKGPRTGL